MKQKQSGGLTEKVYSHTKTPHLHATDAQFES
jgi:hypothetical protein